LVIVSFGDPATEALFHGQRGSRTRRIPAEIHPAVLRKLDMLNAAVQIFDLRVPPGNRLEALHGDRKGFHSIRVNDQWRIVFRWTSVGPERVSLTDYH
jgi:proteic killer suppression protein